MLNVTLDLSAVLYTDLSLSTSYPSVSSALTDPVGTAHNMLPCSVLCTDPAPRSLSADTQVKWLAVGEAVAYRRLWHRRGRRRSCDGLRHARG